MDSVISESEEAFDPKQYFNLAILHEHYLEREIEGLFGKAEAEIKTRRDEKMLQRFLEVYRVIFMDAEEYLCPSTSVHRNYIEACKADDETVKRGVDKYREVIRKHYKESKNSSSFLTEGELISAHDAGVEEGRAFVVKGVYNKDVDYNEVFRIFEASCTLEFFWIKKVNEKRQQRHVTMITSQVLDKARKQLQIGQRQYSTPEELKKKLEKIMTGLEEELVQRLSWVGKKQWGLSWFKSVTNFWKKVEIAENNKKLMDFVVDEFHLMYMANMETVIAVTPLKAKQEHEETSRKCLVQIAQDKRLVGSEEFKMECVVELKRRMENTFDAELIMRAEGAANNVVATYSKELQTGFLRVVKEQSRKCHIEGEPLHRLMNFVADLFQVDKIRDIVTPGEQEPEVIQEDGVFEEANQEMKWESVPIFHRPYQVNFTHRKCTLHEKSLNSFSIQIVNYKEIRLGFFLGHTPHMLTCTTPYKKDGLEWANRIPLLVGLTQDDSFVFGDEMTLRKDTMKCTWNVGEMLKNNWTSGNITDTMTIKGRRFTIKLEFLLAIIFQQIKTLAEQKIKNKFDNASLISKISKVVVIIPPRFYPFQRQQLKDAVQIAGFEESRIINATSCLAYDSFYLDKSSPDFKTRDIVILSQSNVPGNEQLPRLELVRYKCRTVKLPVSASSYASIAMEDYADEELLLFRNKPEALFTLDVISGRNSIQKMEVMRKVLQKLCGGSGDLEQIVVSCEDSDWKWIFTQLANQLLSINPAVMDPFSSLRGGMQMGRDGLWEKNIRIGDWMTRSMSVAGPDAVWHMPPKNSCQKLVIKIPKGDSQFAVSFGLDESQEMQERVMWGTLAVKYVPCNCKDRRGGVKMGFDLEEGIVKPRQRTGCNCKRNQCDVRILQYANLSNKSVSQCFSQMSFITYGDTQECPESQVLSGKTKEPLSNKRPLAEESWELERECMAKKSKSELEISQL